MAAQSIGRPEPTPEFESRLDATFLETMAERQAHYDRYPTKEARMLKDLRSTQEDVRKRASEWLWENASYLFKA